MTNKNITKARAQYNFIDLTGRVFGRLTVLRRDFNRRANSTYWECQCSCGNSVTVHTSSLRGGLTKSCGCLLKETVTTHGFTKTKVYAAWRDMKARCQRKTHPRYSEWGGRGITICARWQKFENFLADMGVPPKDLTLERRDNSGPYSPENVYWADREAQINNTRRSILITYNGETLSRAQWARKFAVSEATLQYRQNAGWATHEILFGR